MEKDHGGRERRLKPGVKKYAWKRLINFCDMLEIVLN